MAVNLGKDVEKVISLKKQNGISDLKADVVFIFDRSGSMKGEYNNGLLSGVGTKAAATALGFDSDKEAECYLFSTGQTKLLKNLTEDNYKTYIDDFHNEKVSGFLGMGKEYKYPFGGTNYAPIINQIVKDFGGQLGQKKVRPTYVVFITDGDNNDKNAARKAIINASQYPIFFQFIGVDTRYKGGGIMDEEKAKRAFSFLAELDDMEGRTYDNANFFAVEGFTAFEGQEILEAMMSEFPDWAKEVKGVLTH